MRYKYKIVEGNVDEIQQKINELADHKWRLIGCVTLSGKDPVFSQNQYIATMEK